jgi:hypothetical protein
LSAQAVQELKDKGIDIPSMAERRQAVLQPTLPAVTDEGPARALEIPPVDGPPAFQPAKTKKKPAAAPVQEFPTTKEVAFTIMDAITTVVPVVACKINGPTISIVTPAKAPTKVQPPAGSQIKIRIDDRDYLCYCPGVYIDLDIVPLSVSVFLIQPDKTA